MAVIDFTAGRKTLGDFTFQAEEAKLLKWIMTAFKPKKSEYMKYCPRGLVDKETDMLSILSKQLITFTYPAGKRIKFCCLSSFVYDAPTKMTRITLSPAFVELLESCELRV